MKRFIDYLIEEVLLVENRIEFLKDKYKDIKSDHDEHAEHRDADKIVDHFATNADPSQKKVYTDKILHMYSKGQVRQEDHPRIKEALEHFDKHKAKLEKKDINQYKTLGDIEDAVRPHIGTAATNAEKKAEVSKGRTEILNTGTHQIHRLDTKEASILHHSGGANCGKEGGSDWCTAADSAHNMFDNYTKNGSKLYTVKGPNNSLHQFNVVHHEDGSKSLGSVMDRRDRPAKIKDVIEDIPKLKGHPEFKNVHPIFDKPEHVERTAKEYTNPRYTKEAIVSGAVKSPDTLHHIAQRALTGLVNSDLSDYGNSHNHVLTAIAVNPHTHSKTIDLLAKGITTLKNTGERSEREHGRLADLANTIVKSPKITADTVKHLADSNIRGLTTHALNNESLPSEAIEHIVNNHTAVNHTAEHEVAQTAASHPNTSQDTMRKLIGHKSHVVKQNVLTNPATPQDVLAAHKDNAQFHAALSVNPSTSPVHLKHIFKQNPDKDYIHANLAKNPSTPRDVLETLSKHSDKGIQRAATKNLKGKR